MFNFLLSFCSTFWFFELPFRTNKFCLWSSCCLIFWSSLYSLILDTLISSINRTQQLSHVWRLSLSVFHLRISILSRNFMRFTPVWWYDNIADTVTVTISVPHFYSVEMDQYRTHGRILSIFYFSTEVQVLVSHWIEVCYKHNI